MNIQGLLGVYNNSIDDNAENINTELELRFKFNSYPEYIDIIKKVLQKSESSIITRTINFIDDSTSSFSKIATREYNERIVNGVPLVEKSSKFTYGTKKRKGQVIVNDEAVRYRVVVSDEQVINEFDVHSFTFIRMKTRLSLRLPKSTGCEDWVIDFTLVKQFTDINKIASNIKIMFLPGLTPNNFLENAPLSNVDSLELEAEYVGSSKEITSLEINKITEFIKSLCITNYNETEKYQEAIYEIAKLVYPEKKSIDFKKKLGLKSFGSSPNGLDKNTFLTVILPNITDYAAGEKAHGVNIIAHIKNKSWITLSGVINTVILENEYKDIVYQAEMVDDIHYIHDVIVMNGLNVTNLNILKRTEFIPEIVKILPAGAAFYKKLTPLTEKYGNQLEKIYKGEYKYHIDGIIFEHTNKDWFKSSHYKWKPAEELTVDFLVMPPPNEVIGLAPHITIPGHDLLFLFCGINKNQYNKTHNIHRVTGYDKIFKGKKFIDYWPIQFAPVSDPTAYIYQHPKELSLDITGRICEFSYANNAWKFIRIRTDRDVEIARGSYFGNNIVVAESTFRNIQDPLTFDMLQSSLMENEKFSSQPYFGKTDSRYYTTNAFSSFVKELILSKLEITKGNTWVVDLACGRGADLFRWPRLGIKYALCIDNDVDALTELVKRQRYAQKKIGHHKLVVHTYHADFNDDYKILSSAIKTKYPIPPEGSNLVVCNMAIHYMCETESSISNFVMLVDSIIAKNGLFTFTCYNGRKIFELLVDADKYESFDMDTLKYSITRSYNSKTFENAGLKIHTLLGFTGGEHRMEYLVNIEYVIKLFKGRGYKLVNYCSFINHLEEYSIEDIKNYDKLSEADFRHLSLYDYVTLKKIKDDGKDEKINKKKYQKSINNDTFVVSNSN